MIYCAHNKVLDKALAVVADSINDAGDIAADYWFYNSEDVSDIAVMSFEAFLREHGGCVEII